jgi:hypothetical protein
VCNEVSKICITVKISLSLHIPRINMMILCSFFRINVMNICEIHTLLYTAMKIGKTHLESKLFKINCPTSASMALL